MLFMVLLVMEHLADIKYIHLIFVGILSLILTAYAFFNISQYDSVMIYLLTVMIFAFMNMAKNYVST